MALGLGGVTATAALAGTAALTAAWLMASSLANGPALRPAAPVVLDTMHLPQPLRGPAGAADRSAAGAGADPVDASAPTHTAALAPSGHVASAPVRLPRQRNAAIEYAVPLPQRRPAKMEVRTARSLQPARRLAVLPTPRPGDNPGTREGALAASGAVRAAAAPTIASLIAADDPAPQAGRVTPPAAPPAPRRAPGLTVLPTPRPRDNSGTRGGQLAASGAVRAAAAPTIASLIAADDPAPQAGRVAPPANDPAPGLTVLPTPRPRDNSGTRGAQLAASGAVRTAAPTIASLVAADDPAPQAGRIAPPTPHFAPGLTVLPTPRPRDNSGTRGGQLAANGAVRPAAAPTIASLVAADDPAPQSGRVAPPTPHLAGEPAALPTPRPDWGTREGEPATRGTPRAPAAPKIASIASAALMATPRPHAKTMLFPERAAGMAGKQRNAQLAYNNPDLPAGPDSHTAIYDIVAHTVYMPDGGRLEAHSGFGRLLDDPRYVSTKARGATPPNVYDLTLRHPLFHGVQAIRLTPANDAKMYGRDGFLAHTYMLGPSGQSIGCVSFKDYAQFLHAFLRGEIDRLVVVPHLRTAPWSERARAANGKRYAFSAL